jgi:DNA-binding beta-propeller fold protein YncE
MQTTSLLGNVSSARRVSLTIMLMSLCLGLPGMLSGQIFLVYSGSQPNEGFISSYNLDGTPANASLISGLNFPVAVAQSDGNLYEVNNSSITIGKYTTAGAPISSTLFTPSNYPGSIAVSEDGTRVFVATTDFNSQNGRIEEYTSAGGTISTGLVTGLGRLTTLVEGGGELFFANNGPVSVFTTGGTMLSTDLIPGVNGLAVAVSGNRLFVSDSSNNTIGEYTTSGAVVNTFLVTGLSDGTTDLAVAGDKLYFLNRSHGTLGVYDLDTTALNRSLVTGLGSGLYGFAVAIPEPSTGAAILGLLALAGVMLHRRRRAA